MDNSLIVFLVIAIIAVCIWVFIRYGKKQPPSSLPSSSPPSPPQPPPPSPPPGPVEQAKVIKTIYRYAPDASKLWDVKWKCSKCETENSRMSKYCELCGTEIWKGAKYVL